MGGGVLTPNREEQCVRTATKLSIRCSCSNCGSLSCLANRKASVIACNCSRCEYPQTCLYYNTNKQIQSAHYSTIQYSFPQKKSEDLNKYHDFNYEDERKLLIEINQSAPVFLNDYNKIRNKEIQENPSTLSEYVDIISGNPKSKRRQKILDAYIKNLKKPKYLKSLGISPATSKPNIEKFKVIESVQASTVSCSIINLHSSTTTAGSALETKVNNCENCTKVVFQKKSYPAVFTGIVEIFNKIKEACKVCSCKVCECIPAKVINDNVCACKPCECLNCTANIADKYTNDYKTNYSYETHTEKKQNCGCKPCQCYTCLSGNYANVCDCQPCECIQCKPTKSSSLKSIAVKHVLVNERTDKYALCECPECLHQHDYDYTCPNKCQSEEMYRDVKYQLDTKDDVEYQGPMCNKAIMKPNNTKTHNIDGETNAVIRDVYNINGINEDIERSMCAMYAALPNRFNNMKYPTEKNFFCKECECTTCDSRKSYIKNSFFSFDGERIQTVHSHIKQYVTDNCCHHCESQVCNHSTFSKELPSQTMKIPKKYMDKRLSNVHLNCLGSSTSNKTIENKPLNYDTCRGDRANDEFVRYFHPSARIREREIKKGDVLTRSAHQNKLMRINNSSPTSSLRHEGLFCKDSISFTKQEIFTYNKVLKHGNIYDMTRDSSIQKSLVMNETDTEPTLKKSCGRCDIIQNNSHVQSQERNKNKTLPHNNLTDISSGSYTSVYTSTISKSSLCNENNNLKSYKKKAEDSSCNSSGHDRPDYLIRFPKSATESCLDNVLKTHDIMNLKTFNFCLKHKFLTSDTEKSLHTLKNESIHLVKSKSTSIETKDSLNEHLNKNDIDINTNTSKCEFTEKYNLKNSNIIDNKHAAILKDEIESLRFKCNEPNMMLRNNNQIINLNYSSHKIYTYFNFLDNRMPDFIRHESLWTNPTQLSFTSFNQHVDTLNMDEDYERVYKTLKEANEFSLYLLELLEMYEKANEEFEKISDKLKITRESILNAEYNNRCENETENINGILNFKETSITTRSGVSSMIEITLNKFNSVSTNISKNEALDFLPGTFSNTSSNLDGESSNKSSILSNDKITNKQNQVEETFKNKQVKQPYIIEQVEQVGDKKSKAGFNDNNLKFNNIAGTAKKKFKNYKKYYQFLKRTVKVKKKVSLKKPSPHYSIVTKPEICTSGVSSEGQISYKPQFKTPFQNMRVVRLKQQYQSHQANSKYRSTKNVSMATAIDEQDFLPGNENEIELEPIQITKVNKNTSTKSVEDQNRVLHHVKAKGKNLEQSGKKTRDVSTMQTGFEDYEIFDSDNFFSTYGSYESQKAKFLLVRKVSDHTVLVKWSKPRVLCDVQGYELLVDGRAVQRVFNPSNYMAVVTCLPHSDKILLTIRTITSVVSESGHYPATTIVYQPRLKML